ncbi:ABC transporter permease [Gracilimonas sediminicola]|uniref:ABC transporter permease n=1 Tax=Gracilimonas sediminicola TaxID=2952158 RepID=A0A9X2L3W0_9BACT|nr:ABC transporter permease [Gracilimonas sediminicola]MCP9291784.1 ABC transporter permease [Gracilimonas sediminicola]
MFKNYLKTAFRSFKRHKSSFLINVIGLSIGMACSILILLWVLDELNYDRFHTDSDRMYQVMEHQLYSGDIMTTHSTPGILAPALKEEVPEFEYVATYTWNMEYLFTKDDKSLKENGLYARPDFFHILDVNILHGNRDELINSPKSVAISKELAEKYFNTENPVGESITINGTEVHTITGVFEKLPENSSFQFDYVLPFEDWLQNNEWATRWGNNGPRTIAKLYPGVDIAALNSKIKDFVKQKDDDDSNVNLFVFPFADLYLYGQFEDGVQTGGRIDYVRLFTIVAIFILLIACINFMNLSTAKATKRAKEVGIRKSIGASQGSLIGQFIGESMIITFFSLLVSVFLVELSLPVFNDLTDKAIDVSYSDPMLLLIFLGTALVTGFVAGSYPAFYLSSFEAVKTLKGNLKISGSEAFARKGLVVFQFSLSVILIISTIVVYQQIQFTQTKNLGYKKENLITFPVEGDVYDNWDTFKAQVKDIPGVVNASRSSSSFMGRNSNTSGLEWPGKLPDTHILFENVSADYGLIETMGFELLAGRSHSEEFGADTARIVINETAAKVMDLENPVGQVIQLWEEDTEIIGLVKDFHFQNLRYEVEPLFFRLTDFGWAAYVRVESDNIRETLAQIEDKYKEFNPTYPFAYEFMDEQYAALYRGEQRIGDLAKYFSIFAIIISCLGLFGLSAFTAEQRAKEIGVRKVLGASVQNLVLHLTKDFTKLVLIAIAIAIPVSWWMMDIWLSDFAYNPGLNWWIFAASGFLAVVIAWLTVSWQSIKAALENPVQSLKSE